MWWEREALLSDCRWRRSVNINIYGYIYIYICGNRVLKSQKETRDRGGWLKNCWEYFSTTRRVHCKPSSSTDRRTDPANITQPRMPNANAKKMSGIGKPRRPRTSRRITSRQCSVSLLPELQQFQFPLPVNQEDPHTRSHTHTRQAADTDLKTRAATILLILWIPNLGNRASVLAELALVSVGWCRKQLA